MSYITYVDELYKIAMDEDQDDVAVCKHCGTPWKEGAETCDKCHKGRREYKESDTGGGVTSKKNYLENRLAERLASEVLDEMYKEASSRQYCMRCGHASTERYIREGHRGYTLGDVRDRDADHLKCLKKDKFFHKEDGKDCKSFKGGSGQEKEASTNIDKWTKKDRKGFIRNTAIATAQDFVNAGNPLNIGNHIVGSVMDSALLEGVSMKMNKKLKAQKVSQKQMKAFNDTKGLTNGTTVINKVNG